MKSVCACIGSNRNSVASFAEAWIEIFLYMISVGTLGVASFAEAWIEIDRKRLCCHFLRVAPSRRRGLKYRRSEGNISMYRSPPSRRRGLKSDKVRAILGLDKVASFAEAWIEINPYTNQNH